MRLAALTALLSGDKEIGFWCSAVEQLNKIHLFIVPAFSQGDEARVRIRAGCHCTAGDSLIRVKVNGCFVYLSRRVV